VYLATRMAQPMARRRKQEARDGPQFEQKHDQVTGLLRSSVVKCPRVCRVPV